LYNGDTTSVQCDTTRHYEIRLRLRLTDLSKVTLSAECKQIVEFSFKNLPRLYTQRTPYSVTVTDLADVHSYMYDHTLDI